MSVEHRFKRILPYADNITRPPQPWLSAVLNGSQRPELIKGTRGDDRIHGRGGDDIIYGYGGDDLIFGGAGSDKIFGGDGIDTVSFRTATAGVTLDLNPDKLSIAYVGDAERDRISEVENIVGSKFADSLSLRSSTGRISAGGGDDHVYIDPLIPTRTLPYLDGGTGYDILDLGRLTKKNYGFSIVQLGDGINNFEEVRGSAFADIIYGGDKAVLVFGGAGNDHLENGSVGGQVSRLYGEDGDDHLFSSTVSGEYHGGDGDDSFAVYESDRNSPGSAMIDGGDGVDTFFLAGDDGWVLTLGSDGATGTFTTTLGSSGTVIDIENVGGSSHDDRLTGNDEANRIEGSLGADVIDGGGGDDIIGGNFSTSSPQPGDGKIDILTGGTGADTFVFTGVWITIVPEDIDRITDFSHAEHDSIDLSKIDPDPRALGDQTLTFVGTAAFSGVVGELRYEIRHGDTLVMVDVDGDGESDLTIGLDGAITLIAADFIL